MSSDESARPACTTILVINGPNLNALGSREPEVYGSATLEDVVERCHVAAAAHGYAIEHVQSNHEGEIVDHLHASRGRVCAIVANLAGWTHTSVVLRDAILAVDVPFVEVHISNVHAREEFRHRSLFSDIAAGVIVGCGTQGYTFAVERLADLLGDQTGRKG